MYKTIGIIGGMGPAATVDLMGKIVDMTDASCDQEHISVLVHSNTRIPDRTAAILHGGANPVPELVLTAKKLEAAGADFLIIPCNTAHYFLPQIEPEVNIPILHIAKETAQLLTRKGVKKAAVLATDGTVQAGIYDRALKEEGIEPIYPDEEQQKLVMSIIYDYAKKGVIDPAEYPCDAAKAMTDDLKNRGAEALILACTELPIGFRIMDMIDDNCVDATSALAAAAVRAAGANVRSEFNY